MKTLLNIFFLTLFLVIGNTKDEVLKKLAQDK